VAVCIIGGTVFATASAGILDRLLVSSDESMRFSIYPRVIAAIADRPILGHGLGSFTDVFRSYVPQDAAVGDWDFAHNTYLEQVFELGLPAAAAFYLALLLIVLRLVQGLAVRQKSREIPAFALATGFAAGFHACFDFSLQIPAVTASFALILGIGYAQAFREADLEKQSTGKRARPQPR
jgi:O-antigen ligase